MAALGDNPNLLYHLLPVKAPLISAKAPAAKPRLAAYTLYDLATQAGQTYDFTAQ